MNFTVSIRKQFRNDHVFMTIRYKMFISVLKQLYRAIFSRCVNLHIIGAVETI